MSDAVHYSRKFLNTEEHGGLAFIQCRVGPLESYGFEAEVTIGDCNRTVTLDFGGYKKDDNSNIRQKIARLRTALRLFEVALDTQLTALERRPPE